MFFQFRQPQKNFYPQFVLESMAFIEFFLSIININTLINYLPQLGLKCGYTYSSYLITLLRSCEK